jgi:hypothetical protein
MMNDIVIERLGALADKADNFATISDSLHRESLSLGMEEIRDELRAIVREYSDEDPWEFHEE